MTITKQHVTSFLKTWSEHAFMGGFWAAWFHVLDVTLSSHLVLILLGASVVLFAMHLILSRWSSRS